MSDTDNNNADRVPLWLLPQFNDVPTIINDAPHPSEVPAPDQQIRRNHTAASLLSAAGQHGEHRHTTPANTPPIATTHAATGKVAPAQVNRRLVRTIVTTVSDELSTAVAERRSQVDDENNPTKTLAPYTHGEERELGRKIIADQVQREINSTIAAGIATISVAEQRALEKEVFDTIFGLGPIQPLVDDPAIENIFINGVHVYVMYPDGRLEHRPAIADSDQEILDWLTNLAQRADGGGRPFSQIHPNLRLNLPGNVRLSAMAWTVPSPQVAIRLHRLKNITLEDLVGYAVMPPALAKLLSAATNGGTSIVTAGPMGSGKTTLTRALANALPTETRIGTAETERELFLDELPGRKPYIVNAEVITGGGERHPHTGEIVGSTNLGDILYQFVRMQLDRVIVGEVAGKEIIDMFKAMQMAKGSLSTTHSENAKGAIDRLVTCALEAGVSVEFATRQVAAHINLIVQLELVYTTNDAGQRFMTRFISEVAFLEPGEDARPAMSTIYRGRPGRPGRPGGTGEFGTMPPALLKKLLAGGLPHTQIPANTLQREEGL